MSSHTSAGRTETSHVIFDFGGGTPHAIEVLGVFGVLDADDTHAIVLTVQGTLGNGTCFEFAMDSFPSDLTQTQLTNGL